MLLQLKTQVNTFAKIRLKYLVFGAMLPVSHLNSSTGLVT